MKQRVRRVGILLILALVLVPRASVAQLSVDVSLGSSLHSLEGATTGTAQGRGTFVGSAEAGVAFAEEKGLVSYTLDRGEYAQPGDWSFLLQRLAGRYRFDLGSQWRLHGGADGTLRHNGAEWESADYDGLGAYLNFEGQPASGLTLRTGYRFDARTFASIPSLDQQQHDLFASVLFNLPTRTTLIAEAHTGAKSYEGEGTVLTEDIELPPGTVLPAGQGARGGGRGMGPSLRPTTTSTTMTTTTVTTYTVLPSDGDSARQFTLLGRVAQSLGDRTGLSFQASWRTTSGQVPPTVVATPAGFFDDGVYDDPFASDLVALQARLKHVRPGGATFQLDARRFDQSFVSALALDATGTPLPGEPLREDQVWRADAAASIPLFPASTKRLALALDLGYSFTHSVSNDAFYEYDSHAAGVAVSVRY